jgi:predicted DNA-binding transcriptional regulator YafY
MLGLLRRERLSVPALAERHGVRRETIYRDLQALEALGFPITGDIHGYKSRPRLPDGFRVSLMPIPFTIQELAALCFSATVTDHLAGTGLHGALQDAIAKIEAHVPSGSRPLLKAAGNVFGAYKKGYKDYRAHAPMVARLVEAMLEQRRCEVHYGSPHRAALSRFAMDPYKLFEFGGALYLYAYVPKHGQVITLAVERIHGLEATNEAFQPIPGFSFERLRDQAFGVVNEAPVTVRVRFRKDQVPYVKERIWHPTQTFEDLHDGDAIMTFHAGGEFEIVRWILSWGSAARVLGPLAIREAVEDEHRASLGKRSSREVTVDQTFANASRG